MRSIESSSPRASLLSFPSERNVDRSNREAEPYARRRILYKVPLTAQRDLRVTYAFTNATVTDDKPPARRAPCEGAVASAAPTDPAAPQRGWREEPQRALARPRRSARERFLPRAHPARARLCRARAHRAAPRRARALLPRHRAALARRQAVGPPPGGVPPQDARPHALGAARGGRRREPDGRVRPPRGDRQPRPARARRAGLERRREAAQRHARGGAADPGREPEAAGSEPGAEIRTELGLLHFRRSAST